MFVHSADPKPKNMKRNKNPRRPLFIATADWHLREDTPVCRMDDFWSAQWAKVEFIRELQMEHDCPIFHAGDLFHQWKPSPYLLSECIQRLPKNFHVVYGNHDLPQHNLDLSKKSGMRTLVEAGTIHLMNECHWGKIPENGSFFFPGVDLTVLVWHVFTYQGKSPWPGCTAMTGDQLLKKYPGFDIIITGDNHKTFTAEDNGRILINPGSLSRQTADQDDHQPVVFLVYPEAPFYEKIRIPVNPGVVSREHLERTEERDERIDAFISQLNDDWKIALNFEDNLKRFADNNQIRQSVMNIVYAAIDQNPPV
jgi:DNA repair exonuclease SbcCD nuclease subunit